MSVTTGSQNWLAGADNTLDNFFKSGSSRTSDTRLRRPSSSGTKRKMRAMDTDEKASLVKRSKLSSEKMTSGSVRANGAGTSAVQVGGTPKKSKNRTVLNDLTSALQNSPRKQRRHFPSPHNSPTQRKFKPVSRLTVSNAKSSKKTTTAKSSSVAESSDEEEDCGSFQLPLTTIASTSRHSNAIPAFHRTKGRLPTPPSSSLPASRVVTSTERSCSSVLGLEVSNNGIMRRPLGLETPFTSTDASVRQVYPTPTSVAIPRLRLVSRDAESAKDQFASASSSVLGFDSPLGSLTSSTSAALEDDQIEHEGETDAQPGKTNAEAEKAKSMEQRSPKGILEDKSKAYTVIPCSQTQYIHYSPTKQRYDRTSLDYRAKSPSLMAIPSSQPPSSPPTNSQTTTLSPRRTQKPRPIVTPCLVLPSQDKPLQETRRIALNFVVPTSQDDEEEIHLLDGIVPISSRSESAKGRPDGIVGNNDPPSFGTRNDSDCQAGRESIEVRHGRDEDTCSRPQIVLGEDVRRQDKDVLSESTQIRFINAILEDIDRLADETRANLVTASQVLSGSPRLLSPIKDSRKGNGKDSSVSRTAGHGQYDSQEEGCRPRDCTRLFMQSSITEPDASQWDDDPFSPSNEAYAKHIGLPRHSDRREYSGDAFDRQKTCTQSSTTQPETQEDDPFPTLPPPSTAQSSADRATVDDLLLLPQKGQDSTRASDTGPSDQPLPGLGRTISETRPDGEDELGNRCTPMPDISSPDDTFDMRLITPRTVRNAVFSSHTVSRFCRRSNISRAGSGDNPERPEAEDGQENGSGDDAETMPSPLRHFLEISSQTESQNQNS